MSTFGAHHDTPPPTELFVMPEAAKVEPLHEAPPTPAAETTTPPQTFEYTRQDGTVERAGSREEAIKLCPVLGKLATENSAMANLMLEMTAIGQTKMAEISRSRPEVPPQKPAETLKPVITKEEKVTVAEPTPELTSEPHVTEPTVIAEPKLKTKEAPVIIAAPTERPKTESKSPTQKPQPVTVVPQPIIRPRQEPKTPAQAIKATPAKQAISPSPAEHVVHETITIPSRPKPAVAIEQTAALPPAPEITPFVMPVAQAAIPKPPQDEAALPIFQPITPEESIFSPDIAPIFEATQMPPVAFEEASTLSPTETEPTPIYETSVPELAPVVLAPDIPDLKPLHVEIRPVEISELITTETAPPIVTALEVATEEPETRAWTEVMATEPAVVYTEFVEALQTVIEAAEPTPVAAETVELAPELDTYLSEVFLPAEPLAEASERPQSVIETPATELAPPEVPSEAITTSAPTQEAPVAEIVPSDIPETQPLPEVINKIHEALIILEPAEQIVVAPLIVKVLELAQATEQPPSDQPVNEQSIDTKIAIAPEMAQPIITELKAAVIALLEALEIAYKPEDIPAFITMLLRPDFQPPQPEPIETTIADLEHDGTHEAKTYFHLTASLADLEDAAQQLIGKLALFHAARHALAA